MKGSIPSPVEEEETLESDADRVGRTPLPKSAFRELLQASPSSRSTGTRTTTLTPTPSDELTLRKRSLLAPTRPGRPRKHVEAEDDQQPVAGSSKHTQSAGPSSQAIQHPRSSRSRDVIDIDEDSAEDDGTEIVAQRIVGDEPRNSKSTHGPRPNQENINIDSGDDQLDIQSLSSSSIHSLPPPRKRIVRKCKGAPYIDLPFLPLSTLKRFTLPAGIRGPNPLSRNEQIQYRQTPPRSDTSPDADSATFRLLQQVGDQRKRSGKFPTWATRSNKTDMSSPDLGGYGEVEVSEDEIESSDGESSDGVEITRRTTRGNGKGKGKEKETRRTTRAEAKVSELIQKLQRRAIDGSSLCSSIQLTL
jgi:hypothetical protein